MYIYVIGPESGPFKIGIARNLESRFHSFQTGHYQALKVHFAAEVLDWDTARKLESNSHETLSVWRLKGEWFSCSLENAIEAIQSLGQEVIAPLIDPQLDALSLALHRRRATPKSESKPMVPKSFKAWRERLSLSKYAAAKELGLSYNGLQAYENGKSSIPRHIALACAAIEAGINEDSLTD
jgi:DNA-binding XRE family transcriptional regulator